MEYRHAFLDGIYSLYPDVETSCLREKGKFFVGGLKPMEYRRSFLKGIILCTRRLKPPACVKAEFFCCRAEAHGIQSFVS